MEKVKMEGYIELKKLELEEIETFHETAVNNNAAIRDWDRLGRKYPTDGGKIITIATALDAALTLMFKEASLNTDGSVGITVDTGGNRTEEKTKEELDIMAPFVSSGEIVCESEYGRYWRFRFENGAWMTDYGEIVYYTKEPMKVSCDGANRIIISRQGQVMTLEADEAKSLYETLRETYG